MSAGRVRLVGSPIDREQVHARSCDATDAATAVSIDDDDRDLVAGYRSSVRSIRDKRSARGPHDTGCASVSTALDSLRASVPSASITYASYSWNACLWDWGC
jgi:hypothetical protein